MQASGLSTVHRAGYDPARAQSLMFAGNQSAPLKIVITGCTSGLGKALAEEYRSRGHAIACCGTRESQVRKLARDFGPDHVWRVVDVSSEQSVQSFAADVLRHFGHADVVIANAGISPAGSAAPWSHPPDTFRRTMDVNVMGVFYTFKHFFPLLTYRSRGAYTQPLRRLIVISSGLGHSTTPGAAAYSASKWAVESLSKSTAQAIAANSSLKNRLICVPLAPGLVQTAMNKAPWAHPLDKWAPAAASFILSIRRSASGASLTVPGFYPAKYKAVWSIPDGLPLPEARIWR